MKEQWKVITMIIALILVVVFALQNTSNVAVDLVLVKFQVPLVLVILFSLLVGVIVGLITSMGAIQSSRKDKSSLNKELDKIKLGHQEDLNEKESVIRQLRDEIEQQKHVSNYSSGANHMELNHGLVSNTGDSSEEISSDSQTESIDEDTKE